MCPFVLIDVFIFYEVGACYSHVFTEESIGFNGSLSTQNTIMNLLLGSQIGVKQVLPMQDLSLYNI